MLLLKYSNVGATAVTEITVDPIELLNDTLLKIVGYIDSICLCLKVEDTYDNEFSELIYTYSYKDRCFMLKQSNDLPKKMRKILIDNNANEYINSILK